jgi:hypothetical protein
MHFVPTLAVAIGLIGAAVPAVAASGDAAKRLPCRPPLAFAHADVRTVPSGDEPRATLLLAVDRRVNGCRVLTPANARNGWVPESTEPQGPARKRPAKQG